jgi:hypothetical protein
MTAHSARAGDAIGLAISRPIVQTMMRAVLVSSLSNAGICITVVQPWACGMPAHTSEAGWCLERLARLQIALRAAGEGNGRRSIATAIISNHSFRRSTHVGIGRWEAFCVMVTGSEYGWLSIVAGIASLTATWFLPRRTPYIKYRNGYRFWVASEIYSKCCERQFKNDV